MQCIKFLCIAVEPHLEVLVVLNGEVLKIAYGVHVLGGLWHLWANFQWPGHCVISDLIHLLIPSITCSFHVLYSQNHLYPPDNHLEYLCSVPGGKDPSPRVDLCLHGGWSLCGFYAC